MLFLKLYLVTLPVFFAIDMIWLGIIAKDFYRQHIGHLLLDNVNWTAAIVFYLMFIGGLVTFVISPAVEKTSWTYAVVYGAMFGLITYATYDLTNLATMKDWSLTVTIVDMIWGMILSASVSVVSYLIATKWVI